MGLQTTHAGDPRGMGIRLVAMGNIFEELCISNVFCSVEFIVVTILFRETLKMLDSPISQKKLVFQSQFLLKERISVLLSFRLHCSYKEDVPSVSCPKR